jgi:hypothetical protein
MRLRPSRYRNARTPRQARGADRRERKHPMSSLRQRFARLEQAIQREWRRPARHCRRGEFHLRGSRHLLTANVANYRRPPVVTRFARPLGGSGLFLGPVPDELSINRSHVKSHRSANGSKRGSLRKRSAARGAEGRAKFMLWPMIAADRSLSR